MLTLLQASIGTSLDPGILKKLPSFGEMVSYYGPFLGLILVLTLLLLVAQYIWYGKLILSKDKEIAGKDKEIARLIAREQELNKRLLRFIDSTGKKNKKED